MSITSIIFCIKCQKRKGPVSTTHSRCGGDEASCQCEDIVAVEQPADHTPYQSSQEDDGVEDDVVEQPRTVEKPAPSSDPRKRLLSPQREAAVAIRRWHVDFFKIGLDFPSCMEKVAHKNPYEIYKFLKLDDCESRRASIDWKINGHAKMQEGAIRNCALKAAVKYEKKAPPCFNPFTIKEYAPNLEELEAEALDKDQIWWLLDKDQRMALLMDEARALQERKSICIRLKAEGDWYQSCISTIRGGSNAIKENMRFSRKKRKVSEYFQNAKMNLVPKKSKEECDKITNDIMNGIDVDEVSKFDSV